VHLKHLGLPNKNGFYLAPIMTDLWTYKIIAKITKFKKENSIIEGGGG